MWACKDIQPKFWETKTSFHHSDCVTIWNKAIQIRTPDPDLQWLLSVNAILACHLLIGCVKISSCHGQGSLGHAPSAHTTTTLLVILGKHDDSERTRELCLDGFLKVCRLQELKEKWMGQPSAPRFTQPEVDHMPAVPCGCLSRWPHKPRFTQLLQLISL